jgi:Cu(I)/Ag(I) efflux system membrane fusion protein
MRYLTIVLAAGSLWMTSCTNNSNETTKEATNTPAGPAKAPESSLDAAGTGKLMAVVNDYYALKDALVATSAPKADEAAGKLSASVDTMLAYTRTDSVNGKNLQPYLDTMAMNTKAVLAVKDETCEQKRVPFEKVSDAMYSLLKTANLKHAGVYRQYCPMAFNEKGAYWLSNETEIKNPYYGKKMLECGEVTDSLK